MKKISTHIIVSDLSQNIEDLLVSISHKENEINIIHSDSKNISAHKNEIVNKSQIDWHMYFEPNEILVSGLDRILDVINEDNCYNFLIIQNNIIMKSCRLWNKKNNYSFINPVFSHLNCTKTKTIDVMVKSKVVDIDRMDIVLSWINENKLYAPPYYYQSCIYLQQKKYKEFLNSSEKYLFYEKKKNLSFVMTKYYRAYAYLNLDEHLKAIDEIQYCLKYKSDMAEFWCLFGDILSAGRDYQQAIGMYNQAMTLGSSRNIYDDYPIMPLCYNEYPSNNITACNEILKNIKQYSLN